MICVGAATEVEVLKKVLAEAEEKAAKEQAACKKLKARLNEVQQELQDAVKKCETLECDVSASSRAFLRASTSVVTPTHIMTLRSIHIIYSFRIYSKSLHTLLVFQLLPRLAELLFGLLQSLLYSGDFSSV